mgnify:CR=1 FL=1
MSKYIKPIAALCALLLWGHQARAQAGSSVARAWIDEYWETRDTALLNKALAYGEAQGDLQLMGEAQRVWGRHYADLDDPHAAVPFFLKALDAFQKTDDKTGMVKTNVNLGFMYYNMDELDLAVKYTETALQLNRTMDDLQIRAIILGNLGSIYEHTPGQMEKALACHSEALSISRQLLDTIGIFSSLNNLGVLYERSGRKAPAAEHYLAALELGYLLGDTTEICRILGNLASLEIKSNQPQAALRYLEQGNAYCRKSNLLQQVFRHKLLAQAYELTGRYREALTEMNHAAELSDSLYALERTKAVHELTIEYETEKKEQQIALLEMEQALQKKAIHQQKIMQRALWGGIAALGIFAAVFFFQRNRISSEKLRSENLLLNILPADVAEELKSTGHSHARQYGHTTVLFTDFVNFTDHAENMLPQDLVTELHAYFMEFDRIVEKYGLEKIKTIGDAYLAVCGLPVHQEDHAVKACRAALDINRFVQDRLQEGGRFQIRIGVHSGPVIAGIVGVKKYAYDIWGDTVNTAARMEQYGEPGKVNVSKTTFDMVKSHFTGTYRGTVAVKNKGGVEMYFLEDSRGG